MSEAMTPEQKAMVMQFMGQTYGETHKQDQNIIGSSGNLSPKSQELKQVFENTARIPTVMPQPQPHQVPAAAPPQQAPPQQAPPQPVQPVTPEQAAQEIAAAQAPSIPDQEEFDFSEPAKIDKLIDLIEKQTLILERISLKLDNGKSAKNRKQR